MKIRYIFLLLLLFSSFVSAAEKKETEDGEDCDRLQISNESLVKMDEK